MHASSSKLTALLAPLAVELGRRAYEKKIGPGRAEDQRLLQELQELQSLRASIPSKPPKRHNFKKGR